MATKEQYESRLLSLGASKFEDLIYDLLEKEFPVLHNLTHTGKVSGKLAARKGTPDIWFTTTLDDKEKFIFVEATTQQNALTSKIQSDLDKCKKHIEEKELAVEKIIYACLGKITPDEFECYQQFCQDFCRGKDSSFEFWGIDYIVHLLKVKYPVLAHEHLGIAIENGSVVEIGEYKNKFGVTEENKFLFKPLSPWCLVKAALAEGVSSNTCGGSGPLRGAGCDLNRDHSVQTCLSSGCLVPVRAALHCTY